MPKRNTLRKENQPQDIIEGDEIITSTSQRVVRITSPNGDVQQIIMGGHTSAPGENGSYTDTELINLQTDHAGNPLPEEPRSVRLSHTGLYISSPEQLAHCTSFFHSRNRSTNILIGQDGRLVEGGATCSHCESWINTIYIVLGIIGVGLVIGLFKGAGIF